MVSDNDTSPGDFTWHEDEQNPNSDENESYSSSVLEQQAYFFLAEVDLEDPEAEAEKWVTFTAKHKSISHNAHLLI